MASVQICSTQTRLTVLCTAAAFPASFSHSCNKLLCNCSVLFLMTDVWTLAQIPKAKFPVWFCAGYLDQLQEQHTHYYKSLTVSNLSGYRQVCWEFQQEEHLFFLDILLTGFKRHSSDISSLFMGRANVLRVLKSSLGTPLRSL